MNIHTPSQHVLVKSSFITDITAGTVNGSAVFTEGFTKAMAVYIASPVGSGTTSQSKLQESPDGTTFSDVVGGQFAAVTTTQGLQIQTMNINLAFRLPYLRLVHTGAGGSAGGNAAGIIQLFNPGQAAVVQDNTPISV